MKIFKHQIGFLFCVGFIFFIGENAYCQKPEATNFPARPINFIIPLPPGSLTDMVARLLCKAAEKHFKQPVVPINKPGGSLVVGVAAVATAAADGYTIGVSAHAPLFVSPQLQKVPYDPVKDFRQIMQFSSYNFGMIIKYDSPFKDFKDAIAYARQNPKKLTYGTATHGLAHFVTEQIAKKEGVQITHIPTRGTPETDAALLGGHILMGVSEITYPLIEAKQTRCVLMLRDERSAEYPDVPILKDLGYDIPCPVFMGILGPKGISDEIAKKLEVAFTEAMKEPGFINGMKELHFPVVYRNSSDLSDYVSRNCAFYEKIIKQSLK